MEQILLPLGPQFSHLISECLRKFVTPFLSTFSYCNLHNSKLALLSYTHKVLTYIFSHTSAEGNSIHYPLCLVVTSMVSDFPVQNSDIKNTLPRPEDFSKALYTMDTGQNDLHDGFTSMTVEQVQKSIPNIINQFSQAIEVLRLPSHVWTLAAAINDSLTYSVLSKTNHPLVGIGQEKLRKCLAWYIWVLLNILIAVFAAVSATLPTRSKNILDTQYRSHWLLALLCYKLSSKAW